MVSNTTTQEGDFRFTHVRMREYNESVAFYRGQAREYETADKRFNTAFDVRVLWLCSGPDGANNGDTACVLPQRGMGVIWATLPSFGFATFNVIFNALAVYGFIAVLSLATGSINGHPLTVNNVITMSSLLVTMATSLGTVRAAHDTQCLHVQSCHALLTSTLLR